MNWRVDYTDDALQDLHGIFDYISQTLLKPGIAAKQTDRIMDTAVQMIAAGRRHRGGSAPTDTGGIVDGITSFFGIRSPSKLFAGSGENMAQGLGLGFEDQMKWLGICETPSHPASTRGSMSTRI